MNKIEYILDRDIYDESMREIANRKIVIDLGSATPFSKRLSKYKLLFKTTHYYALDIQLHPDLDIVADIQDLPLRDNCLKGVICSGVLHLVAEPQKAVEEIYRILNKGGLVFISIPFLYPYHASMTQKDFYRFTKDGLEYMFRNFDKIKLQPFGNYINTTLNFIFGFKLRNRFLMNILEKPLWLLISLWRRRPINNLHNPIGFNILLIK